jgi:hypothetical protein
MRRLGALAIAGAVALSGAACSRGSAKADRAPVETQSATTAPAAPMTTTVTGCLKAGEGSDTYVLTAAQSAGANATATYNLVGANTGDLRGHVGERVQVSGTVTTESDIASRSTPTREDDKKAQGTSGTPTVQTQTDLQMRQLRVDSVSPQGGKCETR